MAVVLSGKKEIVVGREPGCGLSLDNEWVSRHHAKIFERDGEYWVQDLQSRNGTYVNGRKLSPREAVKLSDGDRIGIGSPAVSLTFAYPASVQAEAPEAELPITATISADRQAVLDTRVVPVEQKFRLILQILEDLRRAGNDEQVCQALVDNLMKIFPGAERGLVLLRGAGDRYEVCAGRWRGADTEEKPARYSRSLVRRVEKTGMAVLSHNVPGDPRFELTDPRLHAVIQSVMCAPLSCGGETIGVVQLDAPATGLFQEADLNLLVSIAYPAAVKFEERRFQSYVLEMDLARQVQSQILPVEPPQIKGYTFAHLYRPARAVGGDYFDYIPLAPDRLGLVLADVCGKGIPAALLATKLSSEVRHVLRNASTLPEAAASLNRSVAAFAGKRFVTCLLAVLETRAHELEWVNAGHPWPLHYQASTGRVASLAPLPEPDPPLGIDEAASYSAYRMSLEPGDMVLAFSDGVTEAADAAQQLFGAQRTADVLARAARAGSPDRVCADVFDAVAAHQGAIQQDDICIASLVRRED